MPFTLGSDCFFLGLTFSKILFGCFPADFSGHMFGESLARKPPAPSGDKSPDGLDEPERPSSLKEAVG
jgi:hypothetical protein